MLSAVKRSANYKYWAFGALSIGMFSSVVDHGSVNIALPTVASHYQTGLQTIQWIVISYALTISALLLPMGRMADIVGRTKVYILGSIIFALAAGLAGAAPTLPVLILARIIQGCGAAMSQGTGMAIITATFPEGERGKAIGMVMTVVGVGAIAGPAVGGLLVGVLDWRWVFYINVPLGLLGVVVSLAVLDKERTGDPMVGGSFKKFDWLGTALSTGALLTLLLTIANGQHAGWSSPPILVATISFAALLGLFVWWELRVSEPLLDLRLFQRRVFSLGVSAAFLTFLGSSAVLFLTPFYLQSVLGYSPLRAGLFVVPAALCIAVMGPISGRLSDRYGYRIFTVGGLILAVAGLSILSQTNESSPWFMVMAALVLQSSGMGTFYSPNTSSILSAVERERYGVMTSFLNLIRNGANVTSVAMATVIVTGTMAAMGFEPSLDAVGSPGAGHAFTSGLRNAYMTMACLLFAGMVISAVKAGKTPALSGSTGMGEETKGKTPAGQPGD
ncbi:MAG: MFS transporter [Chloroflexi bacterium]|nr:MFS transporter [Chloroflexota bacterium]